MSTHLSRSFFCRPAAPWLIALVALALPELGRAADSNGKEEAPPPSFTDKTSEAFTKLTPMLTAKNYDGALALLNSILPTVQPDSYDEAVIENTLGGLWIQGKEQPEKAIQPWEHMLDITSRHPNYFPATVVTPKYYYLATIYLQLANWTRSRRIDEATKRAYLDKSLDDMKRFLDATPKPTSEHLYFYATVLYLRATIDSQNIDKTLSRTGAKRGEKPVCMQTSIPRKASISS